MSVRKLLQQQLDVTANDLLSSAELLEANCSFFPVVVVDVA